MVTLFGNLESGNDHKVQLVLQRLTIPFRRVTVWQVRGEPRHPDFLTLNPMGKIPTIVLDDGDVLTESGAILYYFSQDTPLWPNTKRDQAEVLRWMFFEQYTHEPSLAVIRYLRLFAEKSARSEARLRELKPKAAQALDVMAAHLTTRNWLVADRCTIADYALYPYTRMADEAGFNLSAYPALQQWLRHIESQPKFIPLRTNGAVETLTFEAYFQSPR